MEMKAIMYNTKLFKKTLGEKKSWALLTGLILAIILFMIPLLLETSISDGFIITGSFVVTVITVISTLIDFNYLHDARKFSYYSSKPINKLQRMNQVFLVNLTFAMVFQGILMVLTVILDFDLQYIFAPIIPSTLVLILLVGVGSQLSGHTVFAALATAFNYLLPLILYGILNLSLVLIQSVTQPYNVSLVVTDFLNKYINLEFIYFFEAANEAGLGYYIYVFALVAGLYLYNLQLLRTRENEKIGNFIVYKKYEYFVAMIFSLILPFMFIYAMPRGNTGLRMITFVMLASLVYYVASIIMEKTFKLEFKSYKFLATYLACFLILVYSIGFVTNKADQSLPEADEIESVMVSSRSQFYKHYGESTSITRIEDKDYMAYGVDFYTSPEAIESVLKVNEGIVDGKGLPNYFDLNIIYKLKDGSYVRRYYSIFDGEGEFVGDINQSSYALGLYELIRTDEYKAGQYPLVYDHDLIEGSEISFLNIQVQGEDHILSLDQAMLEELQDHLKADLESLEKASLQVPMTYDAIEGAYYGKYYSYGQGFFASLSVTQYLKEDVYFDVYDNFVHTVAFILEAIENQ